MRRAPRSRLAHALAALACACVATSASSQVARLDPPEPANATLLGLSYAGVRSNTGTDETLADPSIRSRSHVATVALRRTFDWGAQTSAVGVSVPYAMLLAYDRAGGTVLRDEAALGDVDVHLEVGLFGRPRAGTGVPDTNGVMRLSVTVPTGEHLAGTAPSVGGNRWVIEARYLHTIVRDAGRTWIEIAPGVRAFGDDDEPRSGSRLRQRPQFVLEGHWSVAAGEHGTWLGAGLVGTVGGRVEIDGVPRGEAARALRAVLSAGAPLRPGTDVLVGYSRTIVHTEEAPRVDRVEFVLRHRF